MKNKLMVTVAAALVAFSALPASAAKPLEGSFSAQLLPFPKLAAWGDPAGLTAPGCLAGEEDVHWAAEEFTAPKNGVLTVSTQGFTGDFDLYILDDTGLAIGRSENNQILDQAPAEEETFAPVKKKQVVTMAVCNWLGAPDVTVDWSFQVTKKIVLRG
jgi:hypothetical protein